MVSLNASGKARKDKMWFRFEQWCLQKGFLHFFIFFDSKAISCKDWHLLLTKRERICSDAHIVQSDDILQVKFHLHQIHFLEIEGTISNERFRNVVFVWWL